MNEAASVRKMRTEAAFARFDIFLCLCAECQDQFPAAERLRQRKHSVLQFYPFFMRLALSLRAEDQFLRLIVIFVFSALFRPYARLAFCRDRKGSVFFQRKQDVFEHLEHVFSAEHRLRTFVFPEIRV